MHAFWGSVSGSMSLWVPALAQFLEQERKQNLTEELTRDRTQAKNRSQNQTKPRQNSYSAPHQHPNRCADWSKQQQHDGRPGAYYPDGAIWALPLWAFFGLLLQAVFHSQSLSRLPFCFSLPLVLLDFIILSFPNLNSSHSFNSFAITTFVRPAEHCVRFIASGHCQRPVSSIAVRPSKILNFGYGSPPCAFYTPK